ncbi:hypothetical protein ACQEVB_08945 [Pseudonocardia sp. CA-107938]|uniref:hypothetical protein n=1 Tax=Pseudonocardia sp. CA-107938 TaxID=3240021 RepID=UPI003D93C2E1
MRVGIAHHLGWAVAVTAADGHRVADRRRIELIEVGVPVAPVEHDGQLLDDAGMAQLVARVRASAVRATSAALDDIADAVGEPIRSISLRVWPFDFPDDIAVLRRPPFDARADSVMYLQVLDDCARARGWAVHTYDAKHVERQAAALLGRRADEVLHGPRAIWGPPWTKDHRMALAATVVAS